MTLRIMTIHIEVCEFENEAAMSMRGVRDMQRTTSIEAGFVMINNLIKRRNAR